MVISYNYNLFIIFGILTSNFGWINHNFYNRYFVFVFCIERYVLNHRFTLRYIYSKSNWADWSYSKIKL